MSRTGRILLVDDDPSLLRVTEEHLANAGHRVTRAGSGEAALAAFDPESFDLVITDIEMPGLSGLDLLAEMKRRDPEVAVIVMTAYGSVDRAVRALKTGAFDFLEKPFPSDVLLHAVENALRYRTLALENIRLHLELEGRFSADRIIGGSGAIKAVFRTIGKVAKSDAPVLIRGESGTGKELIARAVHQASDRSRRPFVAMNCAAIPEGLLDAELFGHVKGAFTGAVGSRDGRFVEADGGTLLLDEIGEMRPDLQAKLLRVLQDGVVRPVGAEADRTVDVRVVAATNRDLAKAIEAGSFRQDLYYRIAVVTIDVPALRERTDDIPLLAAHFLEKKGAAGVTMEPEFLAALRRYRWPGNVRELENVIERTLILREAADRLTLADLPAEFRGGEGDGEGAPVRIRIPDGGLALDEIEKAAIAAALEKAGGNQSEAARLLRVSRFTLIYRMKKHGLAGRGR